MGKSLELIRICRKKKIAEEQRNLIADDRVGCNGRKLGVNVQRVKIVPKIGFIFICLYFTIVCIIEVRSRCEVKKVNAVFFQ